MFLTISVKKLFLDYLIYKEMLQDDKTTSLKEFFDNLKYICTAGNMANIIIWKVTTVAIYKICW